MLEVVGAAVAGVDGLEAGWQGLVAPGIDGNGFVGCAVWAGAAAEAIPARGIGAGVDVAHSFLEELGVADDVVGAHCIYWVWCVGVLEFDETKEDLGAECFERLLAAAAAVR